jgi:hypothetical protein
MVASRSSAGINDKGGKNVSPLYKAAQSVTSYVGGAAREIRDIPTAVGNFMPGSGYSARGAAEEFGRTVKQAAAAVTAGQTGTPVFHYNANGEATGSPDERMKKSKKKK